MRIGIDGYNLAMRQGTGLATYCMELSASIRAIGNDLEGVFGLPVSSDPALRETALFDAFKRAAQPGVKTNRYQRAWRFLRSFRRPRLREVRFSSGVEKRSFADQMPEFDRLVSADRLFDNAFTVFRITGRFVKLKIPQPPQIMHWTYPLPVLVEGARNIYTFHDLVPLKFPYMTLDNKHVYGKIAAECVRVADQLCTVSESSKRDIVERFGIEDDRVTNTGQTASLAHLTGLMTQSTEDAQAIEGIFGLSRRGYLLYYGAIEPKKNIGRLIEAYLSLRSETPLVIVGARSWQSEGELQLMPAGGTSGAAGTYRGHRGQTIIRLDYLPRDLLTKLIRGAKALVFPSLYEGFGLPVLEAMQLGTPVITSNTSSLPEVAGDAGLLVDPYDVRALQEAMRRVDTDEALCREMSARGIVQAKTFSRERYQERLTQLYDAALARR